MAEPRAAATWRVVRRRVVVTRGEGGSWKGFDEEADLEDWRNSG